MLDFLYFLSLLGRAVTLMGKLWLLLLLFLFPFLQLILSFPLSFSSLLFKCLHFITIPYSFAFLSTLHFSSSFMFNYSNDQGRSNHQTNSKPQVYSKPRYYQPGNSTASVSSKTTSQHSTQAHAAHRANNRNNHQHLSQYYPLMPVMVSNPLAAFKTRKDKSRRRVLDSYEIVGYIAAGTYGK